MGRTDLITVKKLFQIIKRKFILVNGSIQVAPMKTEILCFCSAK